MDGGFIVGVVTLGITLVSLVSGVVIYVIRLESRGKLNEQAIQSSLDLVNRDLKHANEYIQHLIDEGKNFKLIQGGFQNTVGAMSISIARMEEKQDATIQSVQEIKALVINLKQAS